jgi:hypothetical protein
MTKVMLKDAPGGAALAEELTKAAMDLSLLFAYAPDDRVLPVLDAMCDRIAKEMEAEIGAENAATILKTLHGAVMERKHAIETLKVGRPC